VSIYNLAEADCAIRPRRGPIAAFPDAQDLLALPRLVNALPLLLVILCAFLAGAGPALAIESVRVPLDAAAIDLTKAIESYHSEGDRLIVSTAPGSDGIVRRIEVRAREEGTRPSWIVFALTNDTGEQLERIVVAPHFRLVGSGVIWPDLGASRMSAMTASQGFPPERQDSPDADIFVLTLDPGTTVTYVAELRTQNLPQLTLWNPGAYKDKVTSLALYKGMVIGVAGLLALFLTIVFVVKGAIVFPAAAALAWTVLAYVCIDFGFWARIFGTGGGTDRIWRAGAEAVLAATLLVFLFAYLHLSRWHVRASHVAAVSLLFLAAIAGLAVYDAPVAAGVARISLATIGGVGFVLVVYLSTHGYDRAIMLIPTWFLLLAWIVGAAFTVTGTLTNDLVSPALIGGLVLIVMLIGFTIMQTAFAGSMIGTGAVSDVERKALAVAGSGDIIFDWDVVTDRVYAGPEVEAQLGLAHGALDGAAAHWLDILHPAERERFRACLDTIVEQGRGRIVQDFRLRTAGGEYFWFRLKARPVIGADGEVIRILGTMSDVTEAKLAEDRLLHDAVFDTLSGLPNRSLFLDRLDAALATSETHGAIQPTVISIDIDSFDHINRTFGIAAGDSVLLTVARRIGRLLTPRDTLARLARDRFAAIIVAEPETDQIIALANQIRHVVATPVSFGDHEISLSASTGIALHNPATHVAGEAMLADAEAAMQVCKRNGGNRIEVFRPTMRSLRFDRFGLAADLAQALDRGEMKIFFQPVVRLEDRTIAGFEASIAWDHPRLGRLGLADFAGIGEAAGTGGPLGFFALECAARELALWQRALDVDPPFFATVNIWSRHWIGHDFLHDLRGVLSRCSVSRGSLKIELSESLVLENPEHAAQVLARTRDAGAGLVLDAFGAGFSSFSYLQKIPFDMVKIDRSLVHETALGTRPQVLRSIIGLAHDLGMDIIAEGAEADKDARDLLELGCDYAQGFAFGHPINAIDARKLVGAANMAA
jgi:diguanylate cyclase (GGDEF)-like protein/PAS domain S-box-containing protein